MSKGSKQRPMDVPLDTFQEKFDRIFKDKKDKNVKIQRIARLTEDNKNLNKTLYENGIRIEEFKVIKIYKIVI